MVFGLFGVADYSIQKELRYREFDQRLYLKASEVKNDIIEDLDEGRFSAVSFRREEHLRLLVQQFPTLILADSGTVVFSSFPVALEEKQRLFSAVKAENTPTFSELNFSGSSFRFVTLLAAGGSVEKYKIILVARSNYLNYRLQIIRRYLVGTIAIAIGFLVLGIGWILRRGFAPVSQMVSRANRISGDDLATWLTVPDTHDEISALARTMNRLLTRQRDSIKKWVQFTADAAHELRTPLAAMKTQIQVVERQDRSPDEYRRVLSSLAQDVDALEKLVNGLLLLSRVDASGSATECASVPLRSCVEDAANKVGRPAGLNNQILPTISIWANKDLLLFAFVNLIENAKKYGGADVVIDVSSCVTADYIEVRVADDGPGVGAADLPKIFDRFFRAEKFRSQPGSGLGLSIVARVVHCFRGTIVAENRKPKGLLFRIRFPRTVLPQS